MPEPASTQRVFWPSESDRSDFNFLVEFLSPHVVDEFFADNGDERDRIVGAGLAQGYAVRVTDGHEVRRYNDIEHLYPANDDWQATDPRLLARLRGVRPLG